MDYDLSVDKTMLIQGRSGAGMYELKGGKKINPSLVCLHFAGLCLVKVSAPQGLRRLGADTGGVISPGSSKF